CISNEPITGSAWIYVSHRRGTFPNSGKNGNTAQPAHHRTSTTKTARQTAISSAISRIEA
ncbi:MAG: hypothetical protein ACXVA4_05540, partial [Ktedonobacterales bacterium]